MKKLSHKYREADYLINSLTSDEDLRQDLWIYHLEANNASSIPAHLENLIKENELNQKIYASLRLIVAGNPSRQFYDALDRLSAIERSIVSLMILNLSIEEISKYKGIAPIRIAQVISTLRTLPWGDFYGTQN